MKTTTKKKKEKRNFPSRLVFKRFNDLFFSFSLFRESKRKSFPCNVSRLIPRPLPPPTSMSSYLGFVQCTDSFPDRGVVKIAFQSHSSQTLDEEEEKIRGEEGIRGEGGLICLH